MTAGRAIRVLGGPICLSDVLLGEVRPNSHRDAHISFAIVHIVRYDFHSNFKGPIVTPCSCHQKQGVISGGKIMCINAVDNGQQIDAI